MTMVAVLSALGTILMMFVKFPYPPAPWCDLEFSDTVILMAYALYGFWGALGCALIKTLFSFIFEGVGFMGVGQIAALMASMSYILGIFLCSHVFKWFKKGIVWRIISYVVIVSIVSVVLTLGNLIFITPTYVAGEWATCFNSDIIVKVENTYAAFGSSYIVIITAIYLPFNLLKGLMVVALYEILFNRLIFVVFKDNPIIQKYFVGSIIASKSADSTKSSVIKDKEKQGTEKEESDLEKIYRETNKKDPKEPK